MTLKIQSYHDEMTFGEEIFERNTANSIELTLKRINSIVPVHTCQV